MSLKPMISVVFFVRGGYVGPGYDFDNAGQIGGYWSSMARPTASSAYYFDFDNSGVTPSNGRTRYRGFSLRCLIPTS